MASAVKSIMLGALLAAAAPVVAQPIVVTNGVDHPASALPRIVDLPGYGTVVVVPQPQQDKRSQRQRCIDEEVAHEGGSPSQLAMGAIDLKCSQR